MNRYMAVLIGTADGPARTAWDALDEPARNARIAEGMQAWHGWAEKHADIIVDQGGPLGKTKRTGARGVSDVKNAMSGYVILNADSHDAAARLFENHPHFSIFPGDGVEIMPIMPIPGQ